MLVILFNNNISLVITRSSQPIEWKCFFHRVLHLIMQCIAMDLWTQICSIRRAKAAYFLDSMWRADYGVNRACCQWFPPRHGLGQDDHEQVRIYFNLQLKSTYERKNIATLLLTGTGIRMKSTFLEALLTPKWSFIIARLGRKWRFYTSGVNIKPTLVGLFIFLREELLSEVQKF